MTLKQQLSSQGGEWRRVEYDGGVELVADFGPGNQPTVDVVDNTAIVIVDDEQFEFDLPDDAEVFMSNGIITIEVNE